MEDTGQKIFRATSAGFMVEILKSAKTTTKQYARYRNPKMLANITLNRLGEMIEPRLHMDLHDFYRSTPACSPEGRRQGFCDDLVPVQTSPLNKHFWKLHGLIDDLIGDWLRAHNYREIAVSCDGRPACYEWQATWIGEYPR